MTEVSAVSDADFQTVVLESTLPVIVDFWAPWCGPCRMVSPIVEELANDLTNTVRVVKVNTDENPRIASQYGIRSIPSMLLFVGGEVRGSTVGFRPKPYLEEWLKSNLQGNGS